MIITAPYLLSVAVPIKMDQNGIRWTDKLWAKDLALHTEYIENLTLVSPRIYANPTSFDVPLNVAPFHRITFVDLPVAGNHLEAIKLLPETARKMWSAICANTVIHTGFGLWPISEGLFATPMARVKRKFLITYVESSFWRVNGSTARWHDKIRSLVLERLNRMCIRSADLRFFTSEAYLTDFLPRNSPHSYVTPATWIDETIILADEMATADWNNKRGPIKLLFAGRLTREKGIGIFLEAAQTANKSKCLSLSIIGDGPLKPACQGLDNVALLSPAAYGPEFFDVLRRHDAIVVPSISDEQPRVLFDAFSQGLPVLGSNTGGIRDIVEDGLNGRLFDPGNPDALASIMEWASSNRNTLRSMGAAALKKSRSFTHRAMHEKRCEIIAREYAQSRSTN
jgi:glycosyltransferase involved in cell wall biosynthesis